MAFLIFIGSDLSQMVCIGQVNEEEQEVTECDKSTIFIWIFTGVIAIVQWLRTWKNMSVASAAGSIFMVTALVAIPTVHSYLTSFGSSEDLYMKKVERR